MKHTAEDSAFQQVTLKQAAIEKNNSDERANDCALQHIKTFREQAFKGAIADFGEPCQNCIHRDICKFDWFSILLPLQSHSNVKINVVVPASSQQLDNIQCETAKDKDTHLHTDMKSL